MFFSTFFVRLFAISVVLMLPGAPVQADMLLFDAPTANATLCIGRQTPLVYHVQRGGLAYYKSVRIELEAEGTKFTPLEVNLANSVRPAMEAPWIVAGSWTPQANHTAGAYVLRAVCTALTPSGSGSGRREEVTNVELPVRLTKC
ncbi:hypothetical protein THASP1DRAFT_30289 [Thamnocephalis sphaerospora]|uniref:Uncharacterized protein n=1 Tax=Thamnocephalis sphaerospora TaxID=78915 RepID=A0A4P9XRG2_9FUNG|nr:hypothetical protein THASP1DRAFT_30289 [Thamnocephalis sphaerospora]|eukprot:RKP07910.1 hypothetical protein THASP1DRAFT_30289 [Thamnocephalis sphaerospora]